MTTADARTRKRYNAYLRRHGVCAVCTMRERGSSPAHCQRRPDRQGGCDTDGLLPVCLHRHQPEAGRSRARKPTV